MDRISCLKSLQKMVLDDGKTQGFFWGSKTWCLFRTFRFPQQIQSALFKKKKLGLDIALGCIAVNMESWHRLKNSAIIKKRGVTKSFNL